MTSEETTDSALGGAVVVPLPESIRGRFVSSKSTVPSTSSSWTPTSFISSAEWRTDSIASPDHRPSLSYCWAMADDMLSAVRCMFSRAYFWNCPVHT